MSYSVSVIMNAAQFFIYLFIYFLNTFFIFYIAALVSNPHEMLLKFLQLSMDAV